MSVNVEEVEAHWSWLKGFVDNTLRTHKRSPNPIMPLVANVVQVAYRVLNKQAT